VSGGETVSGRNGVRNRFSPFLWGKVSVGKRGKRRRNGVRGETVGETVSGTVFLLSSGEKCQWGKGGKGVK